MSFSSSGSVNQVFNGGTYFNVQNLNSMAHSEVKKGFDLLHNHVSPSMLHNAMDRRHAPRCFPGTRALLRSSVEKWIACEAPNAQPHAGLESPQILFLEGEAGSGKTTFTQTLADEWERQRILLAALFLSDPGSRSQNIQNLVATLAYQIALAIPSTRAHISAAVENNPSIFYLSLDVQMRTLIFTPLELAFHSADEQERHFWPRLVIIDGLNQWESDDTPSIFADFLEVLLNTNNCPIGFVITTHPRAHHRLNGNLPRNATSESNSIPRHTTLRLPTSGPESDVDIVLFLRSNLIRIREKLETANLSNSNSEPHPVVQIPTPEISDFDSPPITDDSDSWPPRELIDLLVRDIGGQFSSAFQMVNLLESHLATQDDAATARFQIELDDPEILKALIGCSLSSEHASTEISSPLHPKSPFGFVLRWPWSSSRAAKTDDTVTALSSFTYKRDPVDGTCQAEFRLKIKSGSVVIVFVAFFF